MARDTKHDDEAVTEISVEVDTSSIPQLPADTEPSTLEPMLAVRELLKSAQAAPPGSVIAPGSRAATEAAGDRTTETLEVRLVGSSLAPIITPSEPFFIRPRLVEADANEPTEKRPAHRAPQEEEEEEATAKQKPPIVIPGGVPLPGGESPEAHAEREIDERASKGGTVRMVFDADAVSALGGRPVAAVSAAGPRDPMLPPPSSARVTGPRAVVPAAAPPSERQPRRSGRVFAVFFFVTIALTAVALSLGKGQWPWTAHAPASASAPTLAPAPPSASALPSGSASGPPSASASGPASASASPPSSAPSLASAIPPAASSGPRGRKPSRQTR